MGATSRAIVASGGIWSARKRNAARVAVAALCLDEPASRPLGAAILREEREARRAGNEVRHRDGERDRREGNRRPGQSSHAKRRSEHRRGQRDREDDVAHPLGVVRERKRRQQKRGRHAHERDERPTGQSPPPHVVHDEHAGADKQHDESQPVRRVHRRLEEAWGQPCRRPVRKPDLRARTCEHSIGHSGPGHDERSGEERDDPDEQRDPTGSEPPANREDGRDGGCDGQRAEPPEGRGEEPVPSASDSSKRSTNDSLTRSSTGSRP